MMAMMFDDSVDLTTAVLEGIKDMTRREAFYGEVKNWYIEPRTGHLVAELTNGKTVVSKYAINEVVAVAMNYEKAGLPADQIVGCKFENGQAVNVRASEHIGWHNKMYAKAMFMPNRFKITGIKCEKLQDISDNDCLHEGITNIDGQHFGFFDKKKSVYVCKLTPKRAFEALINRISRKGFWDSNPNVMCYSIQLIKEQ